MRVYSRQGVPFFICTCGECRITGANLFAPCRRRTRCEADQFASVAPYNQIISNREMSHRIPYNMEIRKFMKRAAALLFVIVLLFILFQAEPTEDKVEKVYVLSETEVFGVGLEWELVQSQLPVFRYLLHEESGNNGYEAVVSSLSPLYRYLLSQEVQAMETEQVTDLVVGTEMEKQLLEENARNSLADEATVGNDINESVFDSEDGTGENTAALEGKTDIAEGKYNGEENSAKENDARTGLEAENGQNEEVQAEEANQQEEVDVASIFLSKSEFEPVKEKQKEYNWDEYAEPQKIREEFFAVDATTEIEDDRIQPKTLLEKKIALSEPNGGPQILIYHTHSQETFADSIPGDVNTSIVGAGEYLTKLLKEEYGYDVLHHKGEYDVETRDYAYSYALPNIEAILQEYPSIELVIDLHRDAVAEDKKLVSEQNGKQAAQVMFFNGLSHTVKQGDIDYLENPYIDDNLAFSFQMQVLCNEYYPGLTRRIYLKGYRYNMHLCPQSLLIEMGAQTNTCEEVRNTLDILAHVLSMCLEEQNES